MVKDYISLCYEIVKDGFGYIFGEIDGEIQLTFVVS
jgi:hypothetical protein